MIKGREVSYLTDLAIVGEDGGVEWVFAGMKSYLMGVPYDAHTIK